MSRKIDEPTKDSTDLQDLYVTLVTKAFPKVQADLKAAHAAATGEEKKRLFALFAVKTTYHDYLVDAKAKLESGADDAWAALGLAVTSHNTLVDMINEKPAPKPAPPVKTAPPEKDRAETKEMPKAKPAPDTAEDTPVIRPAAPVEQTSPPQPKKRGAVKRFLFGEEGEHR